MRHAFTRSPLSIALLCVAMAPSACIVTTDTPQDPAQDSEGSETNATDSAEEGSGGSTAGEGPCTVLEQGDLTTDVTLEAGCYEVRSVLQLTNTTLLMEPGVDVDFSPQAGLVVTGAGTLTASGTTEAPVRLHGDSEGEGTWFGVQFVGAASVENRMERVEVRGAGIDAVAGGVNVDAASRLTLDTVLISGSRGAALVAADGAEITVSGSTFSDSVLPLRVGIHTVEGVAEDNVFSDNQRNVVELTGDTLSSATRWPALAVPLQPVGDVRLEAPLSSAPGTRVEFAQDRSLWVEPMGALAAIGTTDAPITFAGATSGAGFWKGISVRSTTADNVLEHAVVDGAGSSMWTGNAESTAAVYIEAEGMLRMTNTTISASGDYAVFASEGANIDGFSGNRIEGNARAMIVSPDLVGDIGADTVFVDNGEQRVRVSLTSLDALDRAQTWNALSVPYLVTQRVDVVRDLVVAPGTTIEFAMGAYFAISERGSLSAVGTADAPIVFTGAEAVPGFWRGLEFATMSADNQLEQCRVEYGGGEAWSGAADSEASVQVGGFYTPGRVTLRSVRIAHSGGNGLQVFDDGSSVACTDMAYDDIALSNAAGEAPPECG